MAKLRCKAAPYGGHEPYIFVSYVHDDAAAVFPIIEHLIVSGYRVWYDEGIHPGAAWKAVIADRLEKCTYFIAMISPRYPKSKFCMQELDLADTDDKPLLPIYLEDFRPPAVLRMTFSGRQAVHFFEHEDPQSFYEKLFITDGLEECLGEAQPPAAESPAPGEPAAEPAAEEPEEAPAAEAPEPEPPAEPEPPKRDTESLMGQLAAELAARKKAEPEPEPEPEPAPPPEPTPEPGPPEPPEPNEALARVLEVLKRRGGTVTSVKPETPPIPVSEPDPAPQTPPEPEPEPEPAPESPKRDMSALMERLSAELASRKKPDDEDGE